MKAGPHESTCDEVSGGLFNYQNTDDHVVFQNEIHGLIEKYSVNESLVEEIEKLKEENRRLKTNY